MNHTTRTPAVEIKKLSLQTTVTFASEHIPGIDRMTLEQLMGLVYKNGTHGSITPDELVAKMHLILKYIPNACPRTFMVLIDLLELPRPDSLPTPISIATRPANQDQSRATRPLTPIVEAA
jgi:hypothetical protein